jgi:hypothetical protein
MRYLLLQQALFLMWVHLLLCKPPEVFVQLLATSKVINKV